MRNMLFVAAFATAALATTYAQKAQACEPVLSLGADGCKAKCGRDCSTNDARADCQAGCVGAVVIHHNTDPCKNQPGTKWCSITKTCVPKDLFSTMCVDKPWCASANDGKGGLIEVGQTCQTCFEIGMLDAPDKRSCVDPCSTDGVLIFSCMSWCPSLNDGHGGFIQASQYAACEACPFGDNGMRCNAKGEGDCPDCNGGGIDPTLLYVLIAMVGLGLILLIVLIVTKKDKDPKPPTSKPASPTKPTTTAPTPPLPRPSGSGPSAPTTAP